MAYYPYTRCRTWRPILPPEASLNNVLNLSPVYNSTAEFLMRQVREYLAFAHQQEVAGNIELADAAGAVAANKLARAIRVQAPK